MDSPGPENVYNCRVGKTTFFCYTKAERTLPFPSPAGMDTEFLISFYTIQRGMSMKKMSFLLSVVMILTLALSPVTAYGQTTYTPDFEVRAEAVYMKNLDTGQVIYEKNPDQRMYPASLTKIMTAIVTLENVEDLDGETAYLKLYLQDMIYGTGSSTGGFYLNDEASIRDILYATLLQSAGECALMLADYVGDGSVDHFVDMMNDKAAELGCTGTHFANPHGLFDENNYTTARDMAIISEYAMNIPEFAEIVGTYTHPVQLLNRDATLNELSTNSMLSPSSQYYYAPVYGIKTGTLPESGRCLSTIAKYNGYTYLLILLGVPETEADGSATDPAIYSFYEAKRLFQWAFNNFSVRTAVEKGEQLLEIDVKYSFQTDFMMLETDRQFTTLMPNDLDLSSIQYIPDVPDYLEAPITKGTQVGELSMVLAGEEIGRVPLITTQNVSASKILTFFGWLDNAIHSYWLKFLIVFTVMLVGLYTLLLIRLNNLKKRKGKYSSYREKRNRDHYL